MSLARCKRECCDLDRSKMTADADFFFKLDFLEIKDDECDMRLGGGDVLVVDIVVLLFVCNGPYNQVTSQSLSQFKASGDTVFNWFLAFTHDLHEAFSSRVPLARFPLR